MLNAATTMSRDEYLSRPYSRETRMEWVSGQAYAMSGGTPRHAAVVGNVYAALNTALLGGPCRPTTSDQLVHIEASDTFVYPDVSVLCGEYKASAAHANAMVNPVVVVEVLSPSTRDYDQGAKFGHYRLIDTLKDYVLVDPMTESVIHLSRRDGGWFRQDVDEGSFSLTGVDVRLSLADLFANLGAFPAD